MDVLSGIVELLGSGWFQLALGYKVASVSSYFDVRGMYVRKRYYSCKENSVSWFNGTLIVIPALDTISLSRDDVMTRQCSLLHSFVEGIPIIPFFATFFGTRCWIPSALVAYCVIVHQERNVKFRRVCHGIVFQLVFLSSPRVSRPHPSCSILASWPPTVVVSC